MDSSPPGSSVHEIPSRLPFHSPGDHPDPGIELRSPALQVESLPSEPPGKPMSTGVHSLSLFQGIFLTQESNWSLLHSRWILYQLSYQGVLANSSDALSLTTVWSWSHESCFLGLRFFNCHKRRMNYNSHFLKIFWSQSIVRKTLYIATQYIYIPTHLKQKFYKAILTVTMCEALTFSVLNFFIFLVAYCDSITLFHYLINASQATV